MIHFASNGFPILSYDSIHLLPIINSVNGNGFKEPVSIFGYLIDPSGQGRVIWYVPLFHMFLAKVLIEPTYKGAMVTVAVLNSLSLFLFLFILLKIIPLNRKQNIFIVICSLFGFSTSLSSLFDGRPESLVVFFILCSGVSVFYIKSDMKQAVVFGIFIGLIASTQLVASFTFALIVGFYFSVTTKKAFNKVFASYLIGFITLLFILFLSPYKITEYLKGIAYHARIIIGESETGSFWEYFIFSVKWTFYGLLFFLSVYCFFFLIKNRKIKLQNPQLFILLLVCFILVQLYFAFRVYAKSYNLLLFAPIFLIILNYTFINIQSKILKLLIIINIILSSIGYFENFILYEDYIKHGITLKVAREKFKTELLNKLEKNERAVLCGISLWALSENYSKVVAYPRTDKEGIPSNKIIIDQYNLMKFSHDAFNIPRKLNIGKGIYELENSCFVKSKPMFWGIDFADFTPGYNYGIYKLTSE